MTREMIANRYRLQQQIGRGGMGTVWVAFDILLQRQVALKLIRPDQRDSTQAQALFAEEARAVARLQHPNVVQVHDFGIDRADGSEQPFMVMELLTGEDLESRIKREKRLPPATVVSLITQAARALGAAHNAGLVHRDLKPANLFLCRNGMQEVLKVLDFGLAALGQVSTEPNSDELIVGTPSYMAPEQVYAPGKVDHRSDLYALAVVAYEALSGKLPMSAESFPALLACLLDPEHRFVSLSQHVPELGEAVDQFFERALHREPTRRFQSARELTVALASALEAGGRRPVRVLVVDDEPDVPRLIRQAFRQQLRRGVYDLAFAASGEAALAELAQHPDTDILLSDINMPGMDGLQLLQQVNEHHPLTRVVMVSAYGDMSNIREAMNRGAYDFLTKPIDFKDLERTIGKTAITVANLRRSLEWAEENAILRMLSSQNLIDRLISRRGSNDPNPCEQTEAVVAAVELRLTRQPGAVVLDALLKRLNDAFDLLVPVFGRVGGSVEQFVGAVALVVFRGESSRERALGACLDAEDLLNQRSSTTQDFQGLELAIAVDAGDLLYAIVGAPGQRRMDYTMFGAPISEALALLPLIVGHQILLTNRLVASVAETFDIGPSSLDRPAENPVYILHGRRQSLADISNAAKTAAPSVPGPLDTTLIRRTT